MNNDQTLDIIAHGSSVSIQDWDNEINISSDKWDFVFNYLTSEVIYVYFKGWHLDASYTTEINQNLGNNIQYLAEQLYIDKDSHHIVFFKVKLSAILLNRALLSQVWLCYDFPSLFFKKDDFQEESLIEKIRNPKSKNVLKEIVDSLTGVVVLHKGAEYDVLWIEKSNDIELPWKTQRSERGLLREKIKKEPWYKRFLR